MLESMDVKTQMLLHRRGLAYLVPTSLAIFSGVLILLVYAPATLVLHLQWRISAGDSRTGSSAFASASNDLSLADVNVDGGDERRVLTPVASGVTPPSSPGKTDGARQGSKDQGPAGGRRRVGNDSSSSVFHDEISFLDDYEEMKKSFKIFVYPHDRDDPFANALLPVKFEPGGNYASESYFKKLLAESNFITNEPSEADLFFLPFSIARLRHDRRVDVGGIAGFVERYVSKIRRDYPYWNRSGGADHFYVACHSAGRSAMDKAEEVKINAIQVVCSASYFLSGYVAHKDVCLPQIWPRKGNPPGIRSSRRSRLAFFAGSINSPVRELVLREWENDSEISVIRGRLATSYSSALMGSKFCLHVKGFEVNTARIADAIFYGCVPVIIANHYDLPFGDVLNWTSFSLIVATVDVPRLASILKALTFGEYLQLHRNLLKVRRHFQWHLKPRDYDAFHMTLYELWLRRSIVRPTFSLNIN